MVSKRLLVVGGVAGGASCAARLRRLDEDAEIVIFERGPYVSFANCGLPYYVGKVIQDEAKLLLSSPEQLKARFNLDVRTGNEVTAIDRERREVEVKRLATGEVYRERYDALVLAPGATAVHPPLPGIDLPGIFVLRTIADSRLIRQWIEAHEAKSAVVVGAGFIGLEIAENLRRRGLTVSLLEMLPQVMPPLDPEMAEFVSVRLAENHVDVRLNEQVAGFSRGEDSSLSVATRSGATLKTDMVLLSMGVRPETTLAKAAGLTLGERGGIQVDPEMRTSDPRIWAVGDVVESRDFVTAQSCIVPLAGPAHRQGRVAADSICGRSSGFRGVQSTAVCGAFGLTIAATGSSERSLRACGVTDYEKIYLHPDSHAAYYPGANPIHMKLLFSRRDGKVLGAQAIGENGDEKRIDVIAMAMQMGATVFDLEEAELCYAPQYSTAQDPVNLAGMIAANVLRGDLPITAWEKLAQKADALVIDVREPLEYNSGHVDGALNFPLGELRSRLGELPREREILVSCGVGQRAYYAVRVLLQKGFKASLLPGGMRTYNHLPEGLEEFCPAANAVGSKS